MENEPSLQHNIQSPQENRYYTHTRYDIIRYVCDPNIKTILSVGCACGLTEKVLIDQYGKKVYGVEYNKDAAAIASRNGIHIIGNDANKISKDGINMEFDCILFADVLEHLSNPLEIIKRCTDLLRKGGIVCISIPNFRHYSVLHALFCKGIIHYSSIGGILDETHLRITTRKSAIEWLETCHLKTRSVEHVFWGRRHKYLSVLFLHLLKDFIAQQIIVIGEK